MQEAHSISEKVHWDATSPLVDAGSPLRFRNSHCQCCYPSHCQCCHCCRVIASVKTLPVFHSESFPVLPSRVPLTDALAPGSQRMDAHPDPSNLPRTVWPGLGPGPGQLG